MTQEQRLLYLIRYLLQESGQFSLFPIPTALSEQKKLFRSLVNIREPKEISSAFIEIQDAYLREEIAEKGVTDGNSLPFAEEKISVWQGDITLLKCSAIVNAANSAMLGCFVPCHKCIDNAIHTYAGVELRAECAEIMRKQGCTEKNGDAKITGAYNLPSDYILHTVGPIVNGVLTDKHRKLLAECYKSCLTLAEEHDIKSLAFPCISTGEFHFPNKPAAEIAVEVVRNYLKKSSIERVIFNVFRDEDRKIYEKLLG